MIVPVFNHKKQLHSSKLAYSLFTSIDELDLKDKLFKSNPYNLITSIEHVEPLIIKFRNHRPVLLSVPTKYFSTTVWVTFYEEKNATKIEMLVKSDPTFYVIYSLLTFGLIASAFDNNLVRSVLPFITSIALIAIIDFVTKRSIFKRVENLLMSL